MLKGLINEELLTSLPCHELWARGTYFIQTTSDLMAALDHYADALRALSGDGENATELLANLRTITEHTLILASRVATMIEDHKQAHANGLRAQGGPLLRLVKGE